MSRSSNQKKKVLYIADLLLKSSNETNPISMGQIIDYLESNGIPAERKSIYDDIEALKEYGLDIIYTRDGERGYYIGLRDFELAELKLLVDAVGSSKFISARKSKTLIDKITKLTNEQDAKSLRRQVEVTGRIKSMNESIFYNVDMIHDACRKNVNITFKYLQWKKGKKLAYKNQGKIYNVSPWMLYWEAEQYYLIAYDVNDDKIKYFRVDKMDKINLTKDKRSGEKLYKSQIGKDFSHKNFHMYSGREVSVVLEATNDIMGVIIDKFGDDVHMHQHEDTFTISTKVIISNQFYGWLAGLSGKVKITAPEEEVKNYTAYLKKLLKDYR